MIGMPTWMTMTGGLSYSWASRNPQITRAQGKGLPLVYKSYAARGLTIDAKIYTHCTHPSLSTTTYHYLDRLAESPIAEMLNPLDTKIKLLLLLLLLVWALLQNII